MKRILVTAGGTATAWHICEEVSKYFKDEIQIHLCDINDPDLVPASLLAYKTHKVPYSNSENYLPTIKKIVEEEKIDVIIPLLPMEAFLLGPDSDFIKELGVATTAPKELATSALVDKKGMYETLSKLGVKTPTNYNLDSIDENTKYMIKPRLGFGSLGIKVLEGKNIDSSIDLEENVIQEYCPHEDKDEVTVEIYNYNGKLNIFSRRRVMTKSGVCVKMVPIDNEIFYPSVKKIVENIDCPIAFNMQFLYDNGEWKLFDCNLRLGAGTGLSTAIGFKLTKALLATLAGIPVDESYFNVDKEAKSVVRVYREVVMK